MGPSAIRSQLHKYVWWEPLISSRALFILIEWRSIASGISRKEDFSWTG